MDQSPVTGASETLHPLAVDASTLARWMRAGICCSLVDVREPWERAICRIADSRAIPLGELADRLAELPRSNQPLVVYCHHGGRSIQAVIWLRRIGFPNAVSLDGGIEAWSVAIDPSVPTY